MPQAQIQAQQPEQKIRVNTSWLNNHSPLGNKEQIGSPIGENTPTLSKLMDLQKRLALLTDHKTMGYCLAFGYSHHVEVSARKGKSVRVSGAVRCNNANCVVCSKIKAKETSKKR